MRTVQAVTAAFVLILAGCGSSEAGDSPHFIRVDGEQLAVGCRPLIDPERLGENVAFEEEGPGHPNSVREARAIEPHPPGDVVAVRGPCSPPPGPECGPKCQERRRTEWTPAVRLTLERCEEAAIYEDLGSPDEETPGLTERCPEGAPG